MWGYTYTGSGFSVEFAKSNIGSGWDGTLRKHQVVESQRDLKPMLVHCSTGTELAPSVESEPQTRRSPQAVCRAMKARKRKTWASLGRGQREFEVTLKPSSPKRLLVDCCATLLLHSGRRRNGRNRRSCQP